MQLEEELLGDVELARIQLDVRVDTVHKRADDGSADDKEAVWRKRRRLVLIESAMAIAATDRRPNLALAPFAVVVAVSALACWLMTAGYRLLAAQHDLGSVIAGDRRVMVGPVLLAVVALLFLAERRWPLVQRPPFAAAHLADAAYLGLFVLIGPLITLFGTGFSVELGRYAPFLVLGRLPLVPQVVVSAGIVVAIDAMNWAAHAANHRVAGFWRFHALHHSQEDMSVLTTFRTHPLSHATYLPALLPALVLSASGTVPTVALIGYGCLVTLPHANLRWTLGPLGNVLVSPAYHRIHHASVPVDGHQTVNFGFVLTVWDRLAGCSVMPSERWIDTGIAGRPVPVEQDGGVRRLPRVMAAQLLQPFGVRAATDGRP